MLLQTFTPLLWLQWGWVAFAPIRSEEGSKCLAVSLPPQTFFVKPQTIACTTISIVLVSFPTCRPSGVLMGFDAQVIHRTRKDKVHITMKAVLLDHMGNDLTVVNAARVSFGKRKQTFDAVKDTRLINYLAANRHTSPFGHCFASFHVQAPVFVARQLVKHKFLRWNEVSRRYVTNLPQILELDRASWRQQAEDKKQGSKPITDADQHAFVPVELHTAIHNTYIQALQAYKDLLEAGVAAEQARMVLPQSMMTEWIWSGSLDAFADMCHLRMDDHAQQESRSIAIQISNQMEKIYPVSWKALAQTN